MLLVRRLVEARERGARRLDARAVSRRLRSRRSSSPSLSSPSLRTTHGSVSPCATSVTTITTNVTTSTRSRPGKATFAAIATGMLSAAARLTTPRTPVNAMMNGMRHDGAGSRAAMRRNSQRGR